jgi:hypothetical protein
VGNSGTCNILLLTDRLYFVVVVVVVIVIFIVYVVVVWSPRLINYCIVLSLVLFNQSEHPVCEWVRGYPSCKMAGSNSVAETGSDRRQPVFSRDERLFSSR